MLQWFRGLKEGKAGKSKTGNCNKNDVPKFEQSLFCLLRIEDDYRAVTFVMNDDLMIQSSNVLQNIEEHIYLFLYAQRMYWGRRIGGRKIRTRDNSIARLFLG